MNISKPTEKSNDKERAEWEHVKWAFKSTAIVSVTLKDHLTGCHFTAANNMATGAVKYLPKDHPVRRLLKPHTSVLRVLYAVEPRYRPRASFGL